MTEKAENTELGWTPATFKDDLDGMDRGDSVGLAETDEAQEAVAEETETEAVQEGGESENLSTDEDAVDESPETSDESETAESVESDETANEAEDDTESTDETKKQHMIPKDRLDQELAKRRQLENRLKELEEKSKTEQIAAPEADYDFDEAETRYMSAVLDGEAEKAKQIRAEIRKMERAQIQAEMQNSMQETSQRTQAQIRLDQAVQTIVSKHPELDVNGEAPNQDLINETNELMSGFLNAGYDPVDALNKAVGYTTASLGINAPINEPAVIPKSVDKKVIDDKTAKKTADSAAKKAKAQEQQPPKLSGESQRSRDDNVVDIFKLTDKELNSLSDEQLRKLRGDFG